jgi:hypothetical protein
MVFFQNASEIRLTPFAACFKVRPMNTTQSKSFEVQGYTANLTYDPSGRHVHLVLTKDDANDYFVLDYAGRLFLGGQLLVGRNVRFLRRMVNQKLECLSNDMQNQLSDVVDAALEELPISFGYRNGGLYPL